MVDNVTGTSIADGEFDIGDMIQISGVSYRIDAITEPGSNGTFTLGDGSTRTFVPGSESNLDVVFLSVSSGGVVRHFVVPNDRFGDMDLASIQTGTLTNVAGSDAAIISTTNNQVNVVCFAKGTPIAVTQGVRAVETLRVGDLVQTFDRGLRPITWIESRRLTHAELVAEDRLRPIRIAPGAIGRATPATPVMLSPQHRVLVRSRVAERMFGTSEVLVAVRHLLGLPGVDMVLPEDGIEYFHFLFDSHEIVLANKIPCENLYAGEQALLGLTPIARAEVLSIVSSNPGNQRRPTPCRPFLSGSEGRKLAGRLLRNGNRSWKRLFTIASPPERSPDCFPLRLQTVTAIGAPGQGQAITLHGVRSSLHVSGVVLAVREDLGLFLLPARSAIIRPDTFGPRQKVKRDMLSVPSMPTAKPLYSRKKPKLSCV